MYDAIIIGAGPAGMSAALYLVRFGRKVALVEGHTYGGQALLTAEIENIPGIKEIKGYEFADQMKEQLDLYPYDFLTEKVENLEKKDDKHIVTCASGKKLEATSIVIASGASYKQAGIPEEAEFVGKGISYCALCDGNFFKGLSVAVVGGGNSALEEALYLSRIVKEVHLIHRRDVFRASKIYMDKAHAASNIIFHTDSVVESLITEKSIKGVLIRNTKTNATTQLDVEGIFIYVGMSPNIAFLSENIKRDERGFIEANLEMHTSVQGIFVAGDVRIKEYKQIATAMGDGVTAGCSANHYIESRT